MNDDFNYEVQDKESLRIYYLKDPITEYPFSLLSFQEYRDMVDEIGIGCYVYSETTQQSGYIVGIILNKYKLPVCFRICDVMEANENPGVEDFDFVSIDRVTRWSKMRKDMYFDDDYGVVRFKEEGE